MQEHSIAALMTEGVIGETCRCTCHDPSPLLTGIEPVAQFRFLIQRIQVVLSDDAGESSVADDSKRESICIFSLLDAPPDKAQRIQYAGAVVQPGKPLAQIGPVSVN